MKRVNKLIKSFQAWKKKLSKMGKNEKRSYLLTKSGKILDFSIMIGTWVSIVWYSSIQKYAPEGVKVFVMILLGIGASRVMTHYLNGLFKKDFIKGKSEGLEEGLKLGLSEAERQYKAVVNTMQSQINTLEQMLMFSEKLPQHPQPEVETSNGAKLRRFLGGGENE